MQYTCEAINCALVTLKSLHFTPYLVNSCCADDLPRSHSWWLRAAVLCTSREWWNWSLHPWALFHVSFKTIFTFDLSCCGCSLECQEHIIILCSAVKSRQWFCFGGRKPPLWNSLWPDYQSRHQGTVCVRDRTSILYFRFWDASKNHFLDLDPFNISQKTRSEQILTKQSKTALWNTSSTHFSLCNVLVKEFWCSWATIAWMILMLWIYQLLRSKLCDKVCQASVCEEQSMHCIDEYMAWLFLCRSRSTWPSATLSDCCLV